MPLMVSGGGNPVIRVFLVFCSGTMPVVGLEFGTVLVEGYSMPEGANNGVILCKGEFFGDESNGVHGIPERWKAVEGAYK